MNEERAAENALDLGTWLGRKQAFSLIAGKCSAADAECLRQIRDRKGYVALGMNWEEFCRTHVGISRQTAERVIRNLEEFGPKFFELAAVVRIAPEQYRQIAGAITDEGVSCDGETIEISAQNTPRLAQAVESLRKSAIDPGEAPSATDQLIRSLRSARKSFQDAVESYTRAWELALESADRDAIVREIETKRCLLERLRAR